MLGPRRGPPVAAACMGDAAKLPPPTPGDLETLLAARQGDADAGRAMVAIHGPSMVRTAWRVLGRYGGTEADDVVQEAFVAALTTAAIPSGGDLGAWLRAITVRKALDSLRGTARRREQSLPAPGGGGQARLAAPAPVPALEVLTVRRALARLRPADRAVLVLADVEGWTMREIARLLGLTTVAVKLRASRARRRLARILGAGEHRRGEKE
jgi:RNA polymerase sigma-70 factor (ECF subfamily)